MIILFLKSHVAAYTKKSGTFVPEHEDKRSSHHDELIGKLDSMFSSSLGIKREDMPQVPSGVKQKFLDQMKSDGISVDQMQVKPDSLKPTQSTYNKHNIQHMLDEMKAGRYDTSRPILVSSDNRVLDGHHLWAAMALNGHKLNIIKIGMPAEKLVKVAKKFSDENGIESRGTEGGPTLIKSLILFKRYVHS